jgi:hypothetical protein
MFGGFFQFCCGTRSKEDGKPLYESQSYSDKNPPLLSMFKTINEAELQVMVMKTFTALSRLMSKLEQII